jgi:isopenicillin N synthase-like dioxygenase
MSSLRFLQSLQRSVRASPCVLHRRSLATVADPRTTGFKIPIIDFSAFLSGNETSKQQTANEILEGFTSSGFIYLSNTSIPPETVSNVFKWSKKFFDLPQEEKLKLAWETPESNRGYVAPGREKVSRLLDEGEIDKIRAAAPDLKESMEIGKEPSDNYIVRPTSSGLMRRINGRKLYLNSMAR